MNVINRRVFKYKVTYCIYRTFWILGIVYFGANILACVLIKEKKSRLIARSTNTSSETIIVNEEGPLFNNKNKKEDVASVIGSSYNNPSLTGEKNKTDDHLKLSKNTVKELLMDINFLTFTGAAFLQVLSRNVPFFFLPCNIILYSAIPIYKEIWRKKCIYSLQICFFCVFN